MSNAAIPETMATNAILAGAGQRFNWAAIVLCAATMFTEGYDAQFMGSVVPGIAKDFGIAPQAVTPALVAGLFGLMLGTFLIAPLADNLGRRRVVIGSVAAFGALTVGSVWVNAIVPLTVLRFLTGLGLGGAMANTTALTAEFSPPGKRATAVAIMFCSFSLGAAFGAFVASWLMQDHGWQSVFLFCGVMALVLLPFLIARLPESIPMVAGARLGIPFSKLFRQGRARITLLLWIIFFANLLELYILTSWLPTTLSVQIDPACSAAGVRCAAEAVNWANFATGLLQIGGIAGAILLSPLVDRFGPQFVLASAFVSAAAAIAILGLAGSSIPVMLTAAFLLGAGTVGVQNCNNGIAAKFYPTEIRATGVGWALAVGRVGSIFGPAAGGLLLSTGFPIRTIFLVAAAPPLIAAAAYLSMGRPKALEGEQG